MRDLAIPMPKLLCALALGCAACATTPRAFTGPSAPAQQRFAAQESGGPGFKP